MDTREKIIELSQTAQRFSDGKWIIVPALFDPLTATQAKRVAGLRENGSKLAAIVLDVSDTLLPAKARASLIAALRSVDLVIVAEPQRWRDAIPASANIKIVEDKPGEAARSAEFVQFVVARQKSA